MPESPYRIVVKVPRPQDLCFIATPFKDEYHEICSSIRDAALNINLRPFTTRSLQRGRDFVSSIFDAVRSAKMIVAVCTPEPNQSQPNPNVMYELGLADSLGKPAIILTNDVSQLPADIRNRDVIEYRSEEVGTEPFIGRLQQKMQSQFGEPPIVLSLMEPDDIRMIHSTQILLTEPKFWKSFIHVLGSAMNVHRSLNEFHSLHIAPLRDSLEEVITGNFSDLAKRRDFTRKWLAARQHYDTGVQRNVLAPVRDDETEMRRCFDDMEDCAQGAKAKGHIRSARTYWDALHNHITGYENAIREIEQCADNGNFTFSVVEKHKDVHTRLISYETKTHLIINNSEFLFVELAKVFTAGE